MWIIMLLIAIALFLAVLVTAGAVLHLLWMLLIGAAVGFVASLLVSVFLPGGGPRGFLEDALAGIIGSYAAGLIVGAHGLVWTFVGAVLVVVAWKLISAALAGGHPSYRA